MSGSNILLMSEDVSTNGPTMHPVYSLDGLGANDPPVIALSFGVGELFRDFTYAVPDDANEHRWLYCVYCVAPFMTNVTVLAFEGSDLVTFNSLGTAGAIGALAFYGGGAIGAATGSNFRLRRLAAVDGAVTINLRIYTFGDADGTGVFNVTNNTDIVGTPAPTVTAFSNAENGDCLFTLGSRDHWVAGRNFSVTNPLTYTYSPTGSAGVGVVNNGAAQALALEFQFLNSTQVTPSATWTFASPQSGEKGAIAINSITGAVY